MSLSTWGKLKAEVQTDFDLWMESKCKDGGEENTVVSVRSVKNVPYVVMVERCGTNTLLIM